MTSDRSKRGTMAKRRGKRRPAGPTAKRTAAVARASEGAPKNPAGARRAAGKSNRSRLGSPASSEPPRQSPRKRLPAWNEIEIDEQRESAGRPEPAFLANGAYADDDLAEEMGEEFVMTATSGEQAAEDLRNQDVPEEVGGPFVETSAHTEFAYGADPSNPKDAEPSAFPMAINSLEEGAAQSEEEQEERTS